jgi:hypothetical protein
VLYTAIYFDTGKSVWFNATCMAFVKHDKIVGVPCQTTSKLVYPGQLPLRVWGQYAVEGWSGGEDSCSSVWEGEQLQELRVAYDGRQSR